MIRMRGVAVMGSVLRGVAVAALSSVDMPGVSAMPSAEMRGVTDVAVSTMSGMTEVGQSSHCHRGEPSAAKREAETIDVHTRYYVSDAWG
jgi:hypothetical protein